MKSLLGIKKNTKNWSKQNFSKCPKNVIFFLTKKKVPCKNLQGKSHRTGTGLPPPSRHCGPWNLGVWRYHKMLQEFRPGAKPTRFRHWKKTGGLDIGPKNEWTKNFTTSYTIFINSPLFFWMLFLKQLQRKAIKSQRPILVLRPPSNPSRRIRGTENHTVHERRTGHSARNGSLRAAHEFPGTKSGVSFWKTWKNKR